jgi:mRNA interferase RelE/StbE
MRYRIYVRPEVVKALKRAPGDVRQRLRRAIDDLAGDARPASSRQLEVAAAVELRRVRVEDWRIIYAVREELEQVQVIALRQRPPYDYRDLGRLLDILE